MNGPPPVVNMGFSGSSPERGYYHQPPKETPKYEEVKFTPVEDTSRNYSMPDGYRDPQFFIDEVLALNSKNVTWKSKLEFTNNLV